MLGTLFRPWLIAHAKAITFLRREDGGGAACRQRERATIFSGRPTSLVVIYSYGDFRAATRVARSDDPAAKPIEMTRESCVPANKVVAFFSNPFANLEAARHGSAKN